MGDWVVAVTATLVKRVRGYHVVDFVVTHHPLPQHNEAAENSGQQNEGNDQVIDRKLRPNWDHGAIQPLVDR